MAKLPSEAQARMIARIFAGGEPVEIMTHMSEGREPWNSATILALVKNKWIEPTGVSRVRNGHDYAMHDLNAWGLFALQRFLMNKRRKGE